MAKDQANVNVESVFGRYRMLRAYVGCQADDSDWIRAAAPVVLPHLDGLTDDFYAEIQRHDETRQRLSGGQQQVAKLKETLATWLRELFACQFDQDYVKRRWLVGWRHVEIGLRQAYVNAAVSRLRSGILQAIHNDLTVSADDRFRMELAINRALDLDLAIIQDAYEAEKHLRSEAVFRSLVEAADCAIFILREDHSVAYVNPFAEAITGYHLGDLEKRDFVELLIPESQQSLMESDFSGVFEGEPRFGRNITIACRDKSQRELVWNVRRLDDFAGEAALLGVGHDITDLQFAQSRALQAERLAAIGQTMAGLAHESRNAFQRIQACLEMLQLEVEDRPEAMELVLRIQRAQNHLHQLNEEVRSYAAPIRLELQPCDLPALWREIWSNLEVSRREKQVELREHVGDGPTVCQADHFALGQVLRNVLENAIAACPSKGGAIDIQVRRAELEEQRAVAVIMQDNGSGFSSDVEANIFEPFFTTKTKGTGLGMAIAKRIVEAHGGQISARSIPENGAEITITLRDSNVA